MYLLIAPPDDADAVTAIEEAIAVGADWLLAEIADFSTHYPELEGSITTGTEGGISTYFALQAADTTLPSHGYGDAAEELAAVLLSHNWIAEEDRFGMGIDDPHLALDVVGNWGTQFLLHRGLTEEAHTGLALAAGVFPVQSWDESVTAMGDIAGPWQPTVEFSAQYAAVGGPGGATILEQLIPLGDNGSYPGATADFNGGPGWNTSWHGTSASSWVYFALSGGLLHRI
jgi:hypothetical protein